eukprot:364496-Chlamydomonas_euryale.AAC.33
MALGTLSRSVNAMMTYHTDILALQIYPILMTTDMPVCHHILLVHDGRPMTITPHALSNTRSTGAHVCVKYLGSLAG